MGKMIVKQLVGRLYSVPSLRYPPDVRMLSAIHPRKQSRTKKR